MTKGEELRQIDEHAPKSSENENKVFTIIAARSLKSGEVRQIVAEVR